DPPQKKPAAWDGASGGARYLRHAAAGKASGAVLSCALLLPGSDLVEALLVLEHQEPALIRQESFALHLVDQRRDEGPRRSDQVRQVLYHGAIRPQHLSEEVAGLQDGEHATALSLALPEQPHAAAAEEEDLVRRHARPVDDRGMGERFDLEVSAEVDDVGRGEARGNEGLGELVPGIDLLAWNHWRAPPREGDAPGRALPVPSPAACSILVISST